MLLRAPDLCFLVLRPFVSPARGVDRFTTLSCQFLFVSGSSSSSLWTEGFLGAPGFSWVSGENESGKKNLDHPEVICSTRWIKILQILNSPELIGAWLLSSYSTAAYVKVRYKQESNSQNDRGQELLMLQHRTALLRLTSDTVAKSLPLSQQLQSTNGVFKALVTHARTHTWPSPQFLVKCLHSCLPSYHFFH